MQKYTAPLNEIFKILPPKTPTPAKELPATMQKETEALAGRFGINKKRVHKEKTEALGNRSKIFREKKELLQRSVLKKTFTKTFT